MRLSRSLLAALRMLLVMTVLTGIAYPAVITAAALAAPARADGSVVAVQGRAVGSSLLGQAAKDPQWFQARPSASDQSGVTSGGSNLGPSSAAQATAVADRRRALMAANPDATGPVPADALTASASGLDPHISPAYAAWQAPRVARASGLPLSEVTALVAAHTQDAALGFIGQDRVNVTELNVALAQRLRG